MPHVFQQKASRVAHLFRDCLQTVPLVIVPGTSYEVAEWYNKWPTPLNAGGVVAELPPDFRALQRQREGDPADLRHFTHQLVYLLLRDSVQAAIAVNVYAQVHPLLRHAESLVRA